MKEIVTSVGVRHDQQSGMIDITLCRQVGKKKAKAGLKAVIPPAMLGDTPMAKGMRRSFLRQISMRLGNAILNDIFPDDCDPD